jgi:Rieske 2Fe-2S family protein
MTSLQPDYLLGYRLLPRAATATTVVADIYFHASAFVPGFDPAAVYSFWDRTNAEDRAICERQQRGLASPSYELGGYAASEDGMHAFDCKIASSYRARLAGVAR